MTKSGKACQRWDANTPHNNYFLAKKWEHNHCRNPDQTEGGVWCYTMDPGQRWDHCNVRECKDCDKREYYRVVSQKKSNTEFEFKLKILSFLRSNLRIRSFIRSKLIPLCLYNFEILDFTRGNFMLFMEK